MYRLLGGWEGGGGGGGGGGGWGLRKTEDDRLDVSIVENPHCKT